MLEAGRLPWVTPVGQVGKVLGERWKALSEKQKAPYEAKAAADKKRYEDEKASYNRVSAIDLARDPDADPLTTPVGGRRMTTMRSPARELRRGACPPHGRHTAPGRSRPDRAVGGSRVMANARVTVVMVRSGFPFFLFCVVFPRGALSFGLFTDIWLFGRGLICFPPDPPAWARLREAAVDDELMAGPSFPG